LSFSQNQNWGRLRAPKEAETDSERPNLAESETEAEAVGVSDICH